MVQKLIPFVAVALLLAGCTTTGTGAGTGIDTSTAVDSGGSGSSNYSEAELAAMTIDGLESYGCELASLLKDPANWGLTDASNSSAPYEMAVTADGDGGAVVVMVTPSSPHAKIALSPKWADSTNPLMYYSGCRGFTTNPDTGDSATDEGSGTEGGNTQTLEIPNFVGFTEKQAKDWVSSNNLSRNIRLWGSYGNNPYLPCETAGYGPITRQSIAAGTIVDITTAVVSIHLDVDCERSHWVN